MKQFSYVLTNSEAMQSRAAGSLLRETSRFKSKINVRSGARDVTLRETRDVLSLGMKCGSRVTVTIEGKDEEAAVAAIQNYFVANM